MKVIIAGSRTINSYTVVEAAIEASGFDITEVVSGCARGVDALGEEFAYKNHIPVKLFPADWDGLGKVAGFIRNTNMAKYADALLAVYDGSSKGTAHMIAVAKRNGLKVFVYDA